MTYRSIDPATGELLATFESFTPARLEEALDAAAKAAPGWATTPVRERCDLLRRIGRRLLERRDELAGLITREMGKLAREARAEIEKCALVCDYYADHAETFLADEVIETGARRSFVAYQPLGTVLAVMPWNFPFWQVMRFAAPALAAGNTALLKHASNVPRCALALEQVMGEAGLPEGVFQTLLIGAREVAGVIADRRVHAVTLTGSEGAGRQVAAEAGRNIKKTVLELGGSDAFIVLEDADLDAAVAAGVTSRFLNCGQSCVAAKRFILVDAIAGPFLEKFRAAVEALRVGDPSDPATDLAPMARADLRDELHGQVTASIEKGAVALTGCRPIEGPGAFYAPSILDRVGPGMVAYQEELFGPVAIVIRARDEEEAIAIANDSPFGLGGSVWCRDPARGEAVARRIDTGAVFVNDFVKSDPRMPFGGVKHSGYGRELCHHGLHEFVNAKTIWIA